MSASAPQHQEVRNYQDILDTIREWPPSVRAALIRDVAETMVEEQEVDTAPLGIEAYENEEMRQIRLQWDAERRAGLIPKQYPDLSWLDELSEEEVIARMKEEWEANKLAHANDPIPPPQDTFSEAYGLLETGVPGPSDEEVKQWLHERRMAKYG